MSLPPFTTDWLTSQRVLPTGYDRLLFVTFYGIILLLLTHELQC